MTPTTATIAKWSSIIIIILLPFVASSNQQDSFLDCSLSTTYDPVNGPFTFSTTNRVPLQYHGCGGVDGTFIDHCCFEVDGTCVILDGDGIPTHDCFLTPEETVTTMDQDSSDDGDFHYISYDEEQNVGVHHENFQDCSKATLYDPDNSPGTYSMNRVSLTRHACAQDGTLDDCCFLDPELGTCVLFIDGLFPAYDCYLPAGTHQPALTDDKNIVIMLVIVIVAIVVLLCCCGVAFLVIRSRGNKNPSTQNIETKAEKIPPAVGKEIESESMMISNLEASIMPKTITQSDGEFPPAQLVIVPAMVAEAAWIPNIEAHCNTLDIKDDREITESFSRPPAKNPSFVSPHKANIVASTAPAERSLASEDPRDEYKQHNHDTETISSLVKSVEQADSSNQTKVVKEWMEKHPTIAKSITPKDLHDILSKVTFSLQKESVAEVLAAGMKGELTCEHVVAAMNECGGSLLQKDDVAKAMVPHVKDPHNKEIVLNEVGLYSREANHIAQSFPSE